MMLQITYLRRTRIPQVRCDKGAPQLDMGLCFSIMVSSWAAVYNQIGRIVSSISCSPSLETEYSVNSLSCFNSVVVTARMTPSSGSNAGRDARNSTSQRLRRRSGTIWGGNWFPLCRCFPVECRRPIHKQNVAKVDACSKLTISYCKK